MPVTFDQCRRAMHAALRREPGPHRSASELVNGFGRWWTSAHAWEYLEGRTADIEVGPDSRIYDLPADLARLDSVHTSASTITPVRLVSGWRHFERMRRGISPGYVFEDGALTLLAGIVRHAAGASPGPQLELTHAPADATWTIRYRGGWVSIASEGTTLPLPWYAEQAFLEGLVVYTLASERAPVDGGESTVSKRLGEFFEGVFMQQAIAQDGEISGDTYTGIGPIGIRLGDDDYGWSLHDDRT